MCPAIAIWRSISTPKKMQLVGLETTLIGGAGDNSNHDLPKVEDVVAADVRAKDSWATFCAAITMGNADMAKNQEMFNKDDPDYQVVSIAAARNLGILPIAFDAATQFQALTGAEE